MGRRDPAGVWRRAGRGDPSAADALESQTVTSRATSFPGWPCGRRAPAVPLAERLRPLPPDRRRVPRARRTQVRERSGWDASFAGARSSGSHRSTAASSSTARLFQPRSARARAPGARAAGRAPGTRACTPRAARVRGEVAVVGAGMAAATEWLNALAAGARGVSVRRREPPGGRSTCRAPLFTKRGLDGFTPRAGPSGASSALLDAPSYPPGRSGTSRSSPPAFRSRRS